MDSSTNNIINRNKEYIKLEMAFMGYYLIIDYAKINNVSRQYISKIKHKFKPITKYNRIWLKHDDGEQAKIIYGEDKNPNNVLTNFDRFGFNLKIDNNKTKMFNYCAIVDIIKIGENKLKLSFHNELNNIIEIEVNENNIKIY